MNHYCQISSFFQEPQPEIEELTKQNIQLTTELTQVSDQLKLLQTQYNEREQFYSTEKIQYEKRIQEISKHPITACVKLQTVYYFI
jgi:predicted nuclease with TOPRIM domain